MGGSPPVTKALREQLQDVDLETLGNSLQGLQSEVPFTSFKAANVGAVVTDDLGEAFLGEAAGLPVGPRFLADRPLQTPLHGNRTFVVRYLTVYLLISSVGRRRGHVEKCQAWD